MEKLGLGLALLGVPYMIIIAFLIYRRNKKQAIQLKQQTSKVPVKRKRY